MPYSITVTQPQHAAIAVLDAAGDPVSELEAGAVAIVDAEADSGYIVQSVSVSADGQAVEMDGSSFIMPEADVSVTASVVEEGGDVPPAPADKAALRAAIESATNDNEQTHVSADGADVYTTDWWATQADIDALDAAVSAALKVADDDAATQAQADAQATAIGAAHAAFLSARSHGSLVPPEQVPDPAGEPSTDGDPSNLYRWTQRFDGTLDEWLLPDGSAYEQAPSSVASGFGVASLSVLPFQEVGLDAGEPYTLSWDEKAKRTATVESDGTVSGVSTGASESADSDGFYRAWATFSMETAGTWATVTLSSATQVRALKMEQGTAPSEWTANSADVDTRDLDNDDPPDEEIVGPSDDTDIDPPDLPEPTESEETAPPDEPSTPDPSDPQYDEEVTIALEAVAAAAADSQHFWTRATKPTPDDGAGTGAFVTDEEQDTFLQAMAQDVQPTTARPLHNLLMNAEGILLRAAKRIRAAFTPSGVAFYDGQGNAASNIVARFGSDGAQVGKDGARHLTLTNSLLAFSNPGSNEQSAIGSLSTFVVDGETPAITFGQRNSNKAIGQYSSVFGADVSAVGNYSHAEGASTEASGNYSHAEGQNTHATGNYSHAEGGTNFASGPYSHAEGFNTIASDNNTHAEGIGTEAGEDSAHSEGYFTVASGFASHSQNYRTRAVGDYQTALGKLNAEDSSSAVIVGNGTADNARSNAAALDWSGNLWLAGTINNAAIPALPASKITSGTFDAARIPSLDASKIGSGTLDAARIPNLNTSKITAGTLGVARGGTGASTLASGSYLVGNGTNAVSLKTPAQVLSDIGAAAASDLDDYLPLSGGTLTGQLNGTNGQFSGWVQAASSLGFGNGAAGTMYKLQAKTPGRNAQVLFAGGGKKSDGNSSGTVVGLGAGGLTIVGGGEYATSRYNVGDLGDGDEQLYLGSDNDVFIETNGNTIANRKTFRFASGGYFLMPAGGTIEADKRIDLGDRSVSGIDYHARLETSQTGALHLIASSGGFSSSNLARGDFVLLSDGRLGVHKHDGTDWVSGWVYYDFTSAATLRSSLGLGDSGWSALDLGADVVAYNAARTPMLRKVGETVNVTGAVKPTAQVASGGSVLIATLPDGCRPQQEVDILCQGSTNACWNLKITTDGKMTAERYRNGATAAAIPTTAWLTFNAMFMVA